MSDAADIENALMAANQQLERLRILSLLLMREENVDLLPESQHRELYGWYFDLVAMAQEGIDAASNDVAKLHGGQQ